MENAMCIGRVKWFDWDKAMGFIQQIDPSTGQAIEDVFVHKSEIRATKAPYHLIKLITGEIVEFKKTPPQSGKPQAQATEVTGFCGGPLICDYGKVEMSNYTYIHSKKKNDRPVHTFEEDVEEDVEDEEICGNISED